MKFLQRLRDQLDHNKSATAASEAQLAEALREESVDDVRQKRAVAQLREVDELARKLEMTNQRNGFSEALTLSFRERPAH